MRVIMGAMLPIACKAINIFRIVMVKVSPGWMTSVYRNRQMHDIFSSSFDDKTTINTLFREKFYSFCTLLLNSLRMRLAQMRCVLLSNIFSFQFFEMGTPPQKKRRFFLLLIISF